VTYAVVVLVGNAGELATWPLTGAGRPDLAVADELARLALAARAVGCTIRLRLACGELVELLDLVGLDEVVTFVPGSGWQAGGQAEGGEQVRVEEAVMPDDPAV
jgi:hypothetical protein